MALIIGIDTILCAYPSVKLYKIVRHPSDGVFMKRFAAIVFWTIVLTVVTWYLYLIILSPLDMNSWSEAAQTAIGIILWVIYIGTPMLVLFFGWHGKLPGTKRS